MAVDQYKAFLVPRACAMAMAARDQETTDVLDIVQQCWELYQPPADLTPMLDAALATGESWSKSLEVWGDLRRNCVEIFRDGVRINDLSFRVDASHLDEQFLRTVVTVAGHCDSVILQPNGELVEPDVDLLRTAVERSRARLYCTDPQQYFRTLDAKRSPG